MLTKSAVLDQARTSVDGAGRIGGWALMRQGAAGKLVAAELRVKSWRDENGLLRVSTHNRPVHVPAGRYRLVLFTDKPTVVTIPLLAGRAQAVTVARETTARAELSDLLAASPVVASRSRKTLTYGGAFVLSQTYFRATAHQAEVVAQCFAPATEQAQSCLNREGFTGVVASPGSVGDGYTSQFTAGYGSSFAPGEQIDVLLDAANVDAPSAAEWLVVSG